MREVAESFFPEQEIAITATPTELLCQSVGSAGDTPLCLRVFLACVH